MILNHIVLPSIEDVISEMEDAFDDINKHVFIIFKMKLQKGTLTFFYKWSYYGIWLL